MGLSLKPGSSGSVLQALVGQSMVASSLTLTGTTAATLSVGAGGARLMYNPTAGELQLESPLGYVYFSSTAASAGSLTSNISAANAGATPGSAMIKMYPQQALDSGDWLLSLGTAANAASVFSVTYGGSVTAALGYAAPGFSVFSGNLGCGQITNAGLIVSSSGALQELTGQVTDGAAAVGVAISPFGSFTNATSKICSFRNARAGTEKVAIDSHGKLIYPTGTADAVAGVATLVGGTVTINTTSVKTGSAILYSRKTTGGTEGHLRISATVDSTSFTITSSSGTETSTVSWLIVN